MKWEAEVARIYWSVTISGNTTKRKHIAHLLSSLNPNYKKLTDDEKEVLRYQNVLDYIYHNWHVNDDKLNVSDIETIYNLISANKSTISATKEEELARVLRYLELSDEHSVIKAGILQLEIRYLSPFASYNGILSRIASYLMLYKNGYDIRGMLVLDEYWKKENSKYKEAIKSTFLSQVLTHWLEFYAEAMEFQLNKTMQAIYAKRTQHLLPEIFWELNERQMEIRRYLLNPKNTISNREVQKRFGVSQITASRDLTKMVKLGTLVARGRGRSTYYTAA